MTILTAIDRDPGCEKVVATAHDLATGLDCLPMIVLHVLAEGDEPEKAEAEIREMVESEVDTMDGVDIRIKPEHAYRDRPTGRTAQNILATADELDPHYIVIGSRKRTPIGKVLLGSVSQLILTNAEAPVVTVEQTS